MSLLDPVPKQAIPRLLDSLDAAYIGLKQEALFRFGVCPNKLIDYMMAGMPVIYAIEAGNDLVAESGCGISVPPEDPQAIADAILQLYRMPPEQLREMGEKGHRYVLAHHDYAVLAQRFLDGL